MQCEEFTKIPVPDWALFQEGGFHSIIDVAMLHARSLNDCQRITNMLSSGIASEHKRQVFSPYLPAYSFKLFFESRYLELKLPVFVFKLLDSGCRTHI